jgi:hypothetical protein
MDTTGLLQVRTAKPRTRRGRVRTVRVLSLVLHQWVVRIQAEACLYRVERG